MITERKFEKVAFVVLVIIILIKVIETITPFQHGDALYYGLVLGKNAGWLSIRDSYLQVCGSLMGGIVEFLEILPLSLMGGNIYTQISFQFLHFILGQALAAYLIYKYFSKNALFGALAAISALTIAVDADFFMYAKTDGILSSIGLLTFLKIYKKENKEINDYHVAFLLGILPMIKLSGLLITAPLAIYYIFKVQDIKRIIKVGLLSIITLSPILIRNFYYVENPFYPAFMNLLPGKVTKTPRDYLLMTVSAPITIKTLFLCLKDFFTGKMLFLLIPVIIARAKYKKDKINWDSFLVSAGIFLFYILVNGGTIASRFFFTCYFLNIIFIFDNIRFKKHSPKWQILLLLIILADSKIDKLVKRDIDNLKNVISLDYKNYRRDKISLSKFWDFVPENSNIISDMFSQQFYAPKGTRLHFPQCEQSYEKFVDCDIKAFEEIMKYDFAILADKFSNRCFDEIRKKNVIHQDSYYKMYKIK